MPFFMKKISSHISLVLVAGTFILSGVLKLRPLEPFEFYLIESGLSTWSLVPYFSRFLVVFELFLATALLSQIKKSFFLKLSIFILSVFTVYLIFIYFFKPELAEDCGCFGTRIKLSAGESIVKNIILIAVAFWALREGTLFNIKRNYLVLALLFSTCTLGVFIGDPPDVFFEGGKPSENVDADFEKFDFSGFSPRLASPESSKEVLVFLSTSCKMCEMAAKKLSLFELDPDVNQHVSVVYWGTDSTVALFENETGLSPVRSKNLEAEEFLTYSGKSLPSIIFLDKKRGVKQRGFRNFDEDEIVLFLSKD